MAVPVDERACPICGSPLPPGRAFCRLSCRLENDRQRIRTPKLFTPELSLENELPTDAELASTRRTRDAIARLYRGRSGDRG